MRKTVMEHNPLMSFDDGLEITFSDIKHNENNEDYVILYFEKPSGEKRGFNSAKFIYPGQLFSDVIGFDDDDISALMQHAQKLAPLALEFSREEANAEIQ